MALLYLGNVSKDFSAINTKKIELYRYVCNFLVDHDSIDDVDILDIHKNLIVKKI